MLNIHQFPHPPLQNYGVLLHDPETGETAAVDVGHGDSYLAAMAATGWTPTQIWITHHHHDHVDGLAAVKAASGAKVYGPAGIDGVDEVLEGGQSFSFAGRQVDVIHTRQYGHQEPPDRGRAARRSRRPDGAQHHRGRAGDKPVHACARRRELWQAAPGQRQFLAARGFADDARGLAAQCLGVAHKGLVPADAVRNGLRALWRVTGAGQAVVEGG